MKGVRRAVGTGACATQGGRSEVVLEVDNLGDLIQMSKVCERVRSTLLIMEVLGFTCDPNVFDQPLRLHLP